MNIEPIMEGKVFKVFDVNRWYRKFFKELDEEKAIAVDYYLDVLADGYITYKPKCFSVLEERICELKPKGTKNQVRLFVYCQKNCLYLLGGFVKKTNVRRRERTFYEVIAKRQKELRRFLNG
jgi:phage-related protein